MSVESAPIAPFFAAVARVTRRFVQRTRGRSAVVGTTWQPRVSSLRAPWPEIGGSLGVHAAACGVLQRLAGHRLRTSAKGERRMRSRLQGFAGLALLSALLALAAPSAAAEVNLNTATQEELVSLARNRPCQGEGHHRLPDSPPLQERRRGEERPRYQRPPLRKPEGQGDGQLRGERRQALGLARRAAGGW